jgi:hypothetical protein
LSLATYSERIGVIARRIECYVTQHPQAADTSEGICMWWLGNERGGDSLEDVQIALDYLVETGRLSRLVHADGTTIYARGEPN